MWRPLFIDDGGFLDSIDRGFRSAHIGLDDYFPNLANSGLFVSSDFMGEQPQSAFRSFSFLITNERELHRFEWLRSHLRAMFRLGKRRISYSKLSDERKRTAMTAFAKAVNDIAGVSATFLVDKKIEWMFPPLDLSANHLLAGKPLDKWTPHSFERMARIVQFIAFFLAGLTAPTQEIIWITDEDEIVANSTRREQTAAALSHALGRFARCDTGDIYVGTTAWDSGNLELEDFAAIPDVIGGAVTEAQSAKWRDGMPMFQSIVTPPSRSITPRADLLIGELFNPKARLRKVVFAIQGGRDGTFTLFELTMHTDRVRIALT
jgi:hypothetical protein